MVNVPLAAGSGSEAFRAGGTRAAGCPRSTRTGRSSCSSRAGFDAHREDPLAGSSSPRPTTRGSRASCSRVAARHAQGRIVSTLEGGYALSALGRSATEHVREFVGA